MNLLESLPTVIGTAAVAPALLVLWLVIATDERPGPPAQVWTAFVLGAASISLLGVIRAPIASILPAPENPWVAQALHSIFAVAAPEEIVKILVIVAVSVRRRRFADPMDTVVYGAAAGLGFAAYENLAYLEQHADMWILLGQLALHAGFDFPLLTLQQNPDLDPSARLMLGAASVLIGFSSIGFAVRLVRRVGHHHAPRTDIARERLSQLRRMWALLVLGGGAGFAGLAFVLTSIHHWLLNPDRNMALVLVPLGLTSILIGIGLLVATTAIYVLGRNRMRTTSQGFSSASGQG